MTANQPNLTNPLSQLADIHLPQAVSIWPPAPGWWLLLAVLILVTYLLQRLIRALWKTHQYRKTLLIELEQIKRQWIKQANIVLTAAKLSSLLRRYYMDQDKRQKVAPLSRDKWFDYLDKQLQLDSGYQELLLELPYQDPLINFDMEDKERYSLKINNMLNIINKKFKTSKRPKRI